VRESDINPWQKQANNIAVVPHAMTSMRGLNAHAGTDIQEVRRAKCDPKPINSDVFLPQWISISTIPSQTWTLPIMLGSHVSSEDPLYLSWASRRFKKHKGSSKITRNKSKTKINKEKGETKYEEFINKWEEETYNIKT